MKRLDVYQEYLDAMKQHQHHFKLKNYEQSELWFDKACNLWDEYTNFDMEE